MYHCRIQERTKALSLWCLLKAPLLEPTAFVPLYITPERLFKHQLTHKINIKDVLSRSSKCNATLYLQSEPPMIQLNVSLFEICFHKEVYKQNLIKIRFLRSLLKDQTKPHMKVKSGDLSIMHEHIVMLRCKLSSDWILMVSLDPSVPISGSGSKDLILIRLI